MAKVNVVYTLAVSVVCYSTKLPFAGFSREETGKGGTGGGGQLVYSLYLIISLELLKSIIT